MEPEEYKPGFNVLVDNPEEPSPLSFEMYEEHKQDEPLSLGPVEVVPAPSQGLQTYFEQSLERGMSSILQDLDGGMYEELSYDANLKTEQMRKDRAQQKFEDILSRQEDPSSAFPQLEDVSEDLFFWEHLAPEVGPLLENTPEMNELEKRKLDAIFAAQRIVQERLMDQPWYKDLGDFGDLALSSGPQNVLGFITGPGGETFEGAGELRMLAREFSDLLVRGLTKEEFEQEANAILDRVEEAGFFTDDNIWYLAGFLDMAAGGGENFESDLETVFQGLDVVGSGVPLIGVLGQFLYKAPRALHAASTLKNFRRAADATVQAVEEGAESLAAEAGSVSLINPSHVADTMLTSPDLVVRRQLEANNAALQYVKDSPWGQLLDEDQLELATKEWTALIKERNEDFINVTPEENYDIAFDDLGNPLGVVVLGKGGGGQGWKVERYAQQFADKHGGRVSSQMVEGETRYFVVQEYNLPTEGFADLLDVKEVATGFFSQIFSSNYREPAILDALAKRGEAQISRNLRTLGRAYIRARDKLSRGPNGMKEKDMVNGVMADLRDDPNKASPIPLTEGMFIRRHVDKYGVAPSKDAIEYYHALQALNDTDYYIQADIILKEAVNNREEMVRLDGEYYWSKEVTDEVGQNVDVYDPATGRIRKRQPDDKVYEVKDGEYQPQGVGAVGYVAGPNLTTRRLYHSDVLSYNPGGHRTFAGVYEHFIKQDVDIELKTGRTGRPVSRTFMATRTQKEGDLAVRQINNIVDAINSGKGDAYVNSVIASNRSWNLQLEDLSDFRKFMSRYGMDATKRVLRVEDSGMTAAEKAKMSSGKSTFYQTGASGARARKEIPLAEFGGASMRTLDPTRAIERGFAKTIARKGTQTYDFRATNAWVNFVKKNPQYIDNYEQVKNLPPRAFMAQAVPSRLTKEGRALRKMQAQINFRLSNTTSRIAAENQLLRRISEFVYDKGGKKLSRILDWASTGDPVGFIRSIAFHTKLGMWNPDQYYVQGNQLMNIIGIGTASIGPKNTMQAMLAVQPLRLALVENIPDAALRRIAKMQSSFTSIAEDDFIKLAEWIKKSGRNVIDNQVVEENAAPSFLGKGRLVESSMFFFREGELMARLGAAAVNFLERKAKYGTEDIFSDRVTNAMIARQDVLTASMTSAAAAPWQKSALALPLQFLTYNVRMMEQILTSKILTPKERASLLFTHVLAYGGAAIPGVGWFMDTQAEGGLVDKTDPMYDLARYGMLDYFLSELTGEETALSSRLSVGDGLFQLLMDTGEESLIETAIGPGGQIGWDGAVAFNSMLKNVFAGKFNHLEYDWHKMARIVSTYDKGYKFWMAHKYGQLISRKSGSLLRDDLSGMEAVLLGLGITQKEDKEAWDAFDVLKYEDRAFSRTVKRVKEIDGIVNRLVEDGKIEEAAVFVEEIGAHLELLNPENRRKLLFIIRDETTMYKSITMDMIEAYQPMNAQRLRELANGQ